MNHILRVTQEFYPKVSGPANQARVVSDSLSRGSWRTTIATCQLPSAPAPRTERVDNVLIRRYPAVGPILHSYVSPALLRAVLTTKFDILHVHGWRNAISDISLIFGRTSRKPVVLQAHGTAAGYKDMFSGWRTWPYRTYDATIAKIGPRAADAVIAATWAERDELVAYGFDTTKIVTIPVGLAQERFIVRTAESSRAPIEQLLFVGRVARARNIRALIEAVGYLMRRGHNVTLRLVGPLIEGSALERPRYLAELQALAHRLGISERVVFVGEKHGSDLHDEYSRAQLFVYASRYENFGQAILEAAAAGLPIVTTPVGVGRDLGTANAAVLVRPDAADLGEAVGSLIGDPPAASRLGSAAQAAARRGYEWPAIVKMYEALYSSLLS